MTNDKYDWRDAKLDEHTRRKHKILREYLSEYLVVRCKHPKRDRFRIVIVDGFCGGGVYENNEPGSPVIIIETLLKASEAINIERAASNQKPIRIEALLILNDPGVVEKTGEKTIDLCKESIAPLVNQMRDSQYLGGEVIFLDKEFEEVYPEIKSRIIDRKIMNVFYNLDQYGHRNVSIQTVKDIMESHNSPEVLLTFAINALMTYLPKGNQLSLITNLNHLGIELKSLENLNEGVISNTAWLGSAEREIFETFRAVAPYTSPFAINNPNGWCYWLLHFAKSHRARQVYNDKLHQNSSAQAHFGRSGLRMLSYDPNEEGTLYAFNLNGRKLATEELFEDIPRAISENKGPVAVDKFFEAKYNETPAHSDDINKAILENPDLQVITPTGHMRRKRIHMDDHIKLKTQRSFFSFLGFLTKSGTDSGDK